MSHIWFYIFVQVTYPFSDAKTLCLQNGGLKLGKSNKCREDGIDVGGQGL